MFYKTVRSFVAIFLFSLVSCTGTPSQQTSFLNPCMNAPITSDREIPVRVVNRSPDHVTIHLQQRPSRRGGVLLGRVSAITERWLVVDRILTESRWFMKLQPSGSRQADLVVGTQFAPMGSQITTGEYQFAIKGPPTLGHECMRLRIKDDIKRSELLPWR